MVFLRLTIGALCLCTAVASLGACPEAVVAERIVDAQYVLAERQSVAATPSVALRLDRVEDSRCRKDAVCVWAGRISYHFTLTRERASESFVLADDAPAYRPALLHGFTITLAGMAPPPLPAANGPAPAYRAVVQVRTPRP